ncbi:MAG: prepilin peptidase, partial [Actinomycetia bacterium]|nr:prepilin peptidase [Actinomycetes bacterium]
PLLVVAAATDHRWADLGSAAVGAAIGFGLLLVINLAVPRGMGMGDVKLAGVEGAFLGFLGVGYVFVGLFLAFVLGAVGGVLLIATGLRSRRDHIPFAPSLAAGALLAVLVGSSIIDWYRG